MTVLIVMVPPDKVYHESKTNYPHLTNGRPAPLSAKCLICQQSRKPRLWESQSGARFRGGGGGWNGMEGCDSQDRRTGLSTGPEQSRDKWSHSIDIPFLITAIQRGPAGGCAATFLARPRANIGRGHHGTQRRLTRP